MAGVIPSGRPFSGHVTLARPTIFGAAKYATLFQTRPPALHTGRLPLARIGGDYQCRAGPDMLSVPWGGPVGRATYRRSAVDQAGWSWQPIDFTISGIGSGLSCWQARSTIFTGPFSTPVPDSGMHSPGTRRRSSISAPSGRLISGGRWHRAYFFQRDTPQAQEPTPRTRLLEGGAGVTLARQISDDRWTGDGEIRDTPNRLGRSSGKGDVATASCASPAAGGTPPELH